MSLELAWPEGEESEGERAHDATVDVEPAAPPGPSVPVDPSLLDTLVPDQAGFTPSPKHPPSSQKEDARSGSKDSRTQREALDEEIRQLQWPARIYLEHVCLDCLNSIPCSAAGGNLQSVQRVGKIFLARKLGQLSSWCCVIYTSHVT